MNLKLSFSCYILINPGDLDEKEIGSFAEDEIFKLKKTLDIFKGFAYFQIKLHRLIPKFNLTRITGTSK